MLSPSQEAVASVLRSGWLTLGPVTAELERVIADRFARDEAVATTSLGAAIELVAHALRLTRDSEIVVSDACPPACAAIATHMGLVRTAEVGPATRAAFVAAGDDALIAAAGETTATVVGVDAGARCIPEVDVCCVGLLEDGDSAAAVVGTAELVERVRLLRSHAMTSGTWSRHTGKTNAYDVVDLGFNHRIDEQRSALALVQLGHELPQRNESDTGFSIPLTDIKIAEDDIEAVLEQLQSGWHRGGPVTERFEREFAAWVGAEHAVGVSSGSAALELALRAAGIGQGDEVLVPAMTFVATAAAVRHCGATPVLCDVISAAEPLLDPRDAERRITPRTRAIIGVHFFGATADTEALTALCERHSLIFIEDAAQAIGARLAGGGLAGTAGFAGCFSLFSKKQLCCGEGGLIACADGETARRLRQLRDEGPGYHLGEPAAALASSRLRRLRTDLWRRHMSVDLYRSLLADIDGLEFVFDEDEASRSSNFAFCVLVRDRETRDAVRDSLAGEGVQTTWYPALQMFSEYADTGDLPFSAQTAERHFALPLSSSTTPAQVEQVVDALRRALA